MTSLRWLSIGITEARLWTLERRVFQKIMVTSGRQEHEDNMRFLSSVPLLHDKYIGTQALAEIAQLLKRVRTYVDINTNIYTYIYI